MKMNTLDWLSWVLVLVGAQNWGFVGLAKLNLVEALLGTAPAMVNFIYMLVGLAGVYSLWKMMSMKKK